MPDEIPDIPPSLPALWNLCGPVLRFRILRDIIGRDESYIQTAHFGLDLLRHPDVQPILEAQSESGLWSDFLTTETAVLHLCEMGLENSRAVEQARERVIEPTLVSPDAIWEFEQAGFDDQGKMLARRIIRDKCLHMLCRSRQQQAPALRPFLEQILLEWDHFLKSSAPLPTADGYAAISLYPWPEDDFPRVSGGAQRLIYHAEENVIPLAGTPEALAPYAFRLLDKWQYLAQPQRLLYELELAAHLGIAREMPSTSWMLEELEARQDADGFFRFPDAGDVSPTWYFPIEKRQRQEYYIEHTFRAELVFKLLAYDI